MKSEQTSPLVAIPWRSAFFDRDKRKGLLFENMEIIKGQLPTEVYRNYDGDIVIYQGAIDSHGHYIIIRSLGAAEALCSAIRETANHPEAFIPEDN